MGSRTSLTPFAHLMGDPDPAHKRRLASEAWHKHGMLVVFEQDVTEGKIDNMWFDAIGRRLYGPRGN